MAATSSSALRRRGRPSPRLPWPGGRPRPRRWRPPWLRPRLGGLLLGLARAFDVSLSRRSCSWRASSSRRSGLGSAASASRWRSRSSRSVFSRRSLPWRSIRSCWRRSSSLAQAALLLVDHRVGGDRGGGTATARPPALLGAASRFTKTRFLRTSTWIVRALPVASACLISEVCLRTTVIFFFGRRRRHGRRAAPSAAAPCPPR